MSKKANRLGRRFASLAAENRKALVSYAVACDPSFDESLEQLFIYARAGVDVIEVGYPFSDPILDGPTIQKANQRALAAGGSLARTLDVCARFRRKDAVTPLVLMGYANPLAAMGYEAFAARAAAAGVDGVIIADMPLREADELLSSLAAEHLFMIPLSAPNLSTNDYAVKRRGIGGFLYCIPVIGPTGGPSASFEEVSRAVVRCRAASQLPILVGFGIKTPEMANAVAQIADGVIVATALLDSFLSLRSRKLSKRQYADRVFSVLTAYRRAVDGDVRPASA
jgi:tryptophan synthase alpha chain